MGGLGNGAASIKLKFFIRWSIHGIFLIVAKTNGIDIDSGICGVPRINATITGRIVNGTPTVAGKWPWQVLMMEKGTHHCGGSLIGDEWILTAAHCITGDITTHTFFVGAYRVDASGSNAKEVKAHLFICHEDFDEETFAYDLCLVKLAQPIKFTDHIVPICLPMVGTSVAVGDQTIATGWGETQGTGSGYELRQAVLPVLDIDQCKAWYNSVSIGIPNKHFCAGYEEGGTDTCQGDSGGPLVHEETSASGRTAYVLRGITSFGAGCAQKQRPGVYANVSEYIVWIDGVISRLSSSSCVAVQSTVCGGNIEKSTTIRNPTKSDGFAYPSNTECTWKVSAPSNFWLQFNFICYFLLSPQGDDCDDSLSITNKTGYTETFCGNELPESYLVMDNVATLVFSTNGALEYPGFVMEVEFIPPSELTQTTSIIDTSANAEATTSTGTELKTTSVIALSMLLAKSLSTHW